MSTPLPRRWFGVVWAFAVTAALGLQWAGTAEPDGDEEAEGHRGPHAMRVMPDGPAEFAKFRRLQMADENGQIEPGALMRATAQAEAMRNAAVGNAGGISRGSWTWLGPGNIGGRTRGLAVHPTSTSTLFAGSVAGGLWKTTNGGASWAVVDDFMANLAVSCVVFQPGSPSVMFAGTGEGYYNGDRIQGAGIFGSTDGGTTWAQLPSTATTDYLFVNRIAFSADSTIMLAATSTGLFRSTNAGGSWTKVITTGFAYPDITDVDFLPGSSTLAVASGYQRNVYYSTNGGTTWTPSTIPSVGGVTNFNRIELGVATAGTSSTVYALVDLKTESSATSTQLWKSVNNGVAFSQVSTNGGFLSTQGWYDNAIWVSPTDSETVVVGGVDLYRSTNGGVGFTKISSWQIAPNSAHADHHTIVNDPGYNGTTNTRVYFANDGGVYKAENVLTVTSASGGGFTSLNNNYGVTQFFGAGGNSTTGKIIGGTQDNGTLLYSPSGGPQAWTTVFGGDGGFSAADQSNSNYMYGEYTYLTIHRSSNGGAGSDGFIYAPSTASCTAASPIYCITDAYNSYANFIAPFILDPNTSSRLLAGGASLWRSNDPRTPMTSSTGPQWVAIKPPTNPADPGNYWGYISAIAVARGNSDVIWVGHNSGDVYVTSNGTAASPTWTKVDGATLPNRRVNRIAVIDSSTALVGFGGFTTNNVWKTSNTGASWTASSGSGASALPSAPVYALVVHPTDGSRVYAGTEVGVFASTDGGANWSTPHDGPANVSVDELMFVGAQLVTVTHGRGVFTSSLGDARMNIDLPGDQTTVTPPFAVAGWAVDRNESIGAGVDAVHVYAFPNNNGTFGGGIFLGGATTGLPRGDVGTVFGSQFTNSGFSLTVSPTQLQAGAYRIVSYGRSTVSGSFNVQQSRDITVNACTQTMALDRPGNNSTVGSAFTLSGWAVDRCASSGSGVDTVHVYAFPLVNGTFGGGIFLGSAAYGQSRSDVGAILGSQATNSGFSLSASGLTAGAYRVVAYARSSVSGTFNQSRFADITIASQPNMALDQPQASGFSVNAGQQFTVAGWAVDLGAASGNGVDVVHVYAFPVTNGTFGAGILIGAASINRSRPDVGAVFGIQFNTSGFSAQASIGTAGNYRVVAYAHSLVSGTFNQQRFADISVR